ncbi:MAG TPA: cell division protein FtsQ/DivIB [Salinarimonas sp.]|jgi:cell division protein FtsQ|nr:cell division protein FtsQ/DivIB [Salinarimonas sp.]
MDGGGRLDGPLTPGFSRGGRRVAARTAGLPFLRRRSAVAVPGGAGPVPRHLGSALAVAFFAAVVGVGLQAGGHLDEIQARAGAPRDAVARALGFGIDHVTVSGLAQLQPDEVLTTGGITARSSLPFLDAGEVRQRLEAMPLVKSAAVRKLYPGELLVTLEERRAHALWQRNGEIVVVAADGTVIDTLRDARFASLPLVVGEGANARTAEYLALIEAAGPLKGRIKAGTLVSGRRWTLKIDGLDVRLPEHGAEAALARLARLEREQKILDRDVIAIDLRMADRVVVRLTEEAAAARAEAMKKKPTRGKGVDT